MPKVSVVVPIFGVEKYIEKCARSLFEQTLDDIEYIFVNDCTLDNSMEILGRIIEEYPVREAQVRIINMPVNSGQAKVRKVGTEVATGDYIIHCDSDDWADVAMYKTLYDLALETNADMVVCDLFFDRGNLSSKMCNVLPNKTNKDSIFRVILKEDVFHFLPCCLCRRQIITDNQYIFPKCNCAEDFVFFVQMAYFSSKIVFCDQPLYHYSYNAVSITGDMSKSRILDRCDQVFNNTNSILCFLEQHGLTEKYASEIVMMKYAVRCHLKPLLLDMDVYKKWRSIYPEIDSQLLKCKDLPLKKKVSYIISYIRLEPFYRKLYSRFHK